jgi:hypothetical protein
VLNEGEEGSSGAVVLRVAADRSLSHRRVRRRVRGGCLAEEPTAHFGIGWQGSSHAEAGGEGQN